MPDWLIALISFACGLGLGTFIGIYGVLFGFRLGNHLNREEP